MQGLACRNPRSRFRACISHSVDPSVQAQKRPSHRRGGVPQDSRGTQCESPFALRESFRTSPKRERGGVPQDSRGTQCESPFTLRGPFCTSPKRERGGVPQDSRGTQCESPFALRESFRTSPKVAERGGVPQDSRGTQCESPGDPASIRLLEQPEDFVELAVDRIDALFDRRRRSAPRASFPSGLALSTGSWRADCSGAVDSSIIPPPPVGSTTS